MRLVNFFNFLYDIRFCFFFLFDFQILSGITISLISTCLIVGYMMTLANVVFPLNEFPEWAMLNTTANTNE